MDASRQIRYRRAIRQSGVARKLLEVARASWSDEDWDAYFASEQRAQELLTEATTKNLH